MLLDLISQFTPEILFPRPYGGLSRNLFLGSAVHMPTRPCFDRKHRWFNFTYRGRKMLPSTGGCGGKTAAAGTTDTWLICQPTLIRVIIFVVRANWKNIKQEQAL